MYYFSVQRAKDNNESMNVIMRVVGLDAVEVVGDTEIAIDNDYFRI